MSDSLNIKRYRLLPGGNQGSDVRRWKLRQVCDESSRPGDGADAAPPACAQLSAAMYASPART
jgi:hypothetical protein